MNTARNKSVARAGAGTPAAARPGRGRGMIVLGVALLAAGAVAFAVISTSGDGGAAGGLADGAAVAKPAGASPPRVLPVGPGAAAQNPGLAKADEEKVNAILKETERLDQTVFAREVESQRYEEYFIRLWDDFRAAKDKAAVLEAAVFQTLSFGEAGEQSEHDWDVIVTAFDGAARPVDQAGWRAMLGGLREAGYRPTELEFHQSSFEHEPGQPARSVIATVVHLVNPDQNSRQVVRTKLKVEWSDQPDKPGEGGMFVPRTIEATELSISERVGDVPFAEVVLPGSTPAGLHLPGAGSGFVLVYDLDGDGRSEIIVPGENMVLRNRGDWTFSRERLLAGGLLGEMGAGVIGDFNGDGLPDLLCTKEDRLYLLRGAPGGRFGATPPELAVDISDAWQVSVITAGDIDGDGDLDAWFGQYKAPYHGGQMPTPYYDANDGLPGALLLNDGSGRFTDATESAGLASKRLRRTFAASLVDLDGDRDLDLLVNSDFAGLDIYYNDGKGKFTDVTEQVVDERHNFGMGHTFADFNLDGRLDMYTIGMSSTTARRLTAMGVGREEFPRHQEKRPQMGYGNRMFLAGAPANGASRAPVAFSQPTFKDDVARTGWSWGAAAPDFDNDGDPDIFVANGHKSGTTCRDYCTTYWRRDIYLASSQEDPVMKNLFEVSGMSREISWNGFEHDVLYMNEAGNGFLNVSHLMGVAFEFDGRNVISDDFDGDGRMDLLVLEKRSAEEGRYIHVLRNAWPTTHNWVGVRLAESGPGFSPIGAEVRVRAGGRVQIGRIVTGDSIHSQHPTSRHFGVGAADKIEWVEVAWPNGEVTRVEGPAINTWHDVRPAGPATAAR